MPTVPTPRRTWRARVSSAASWALLAVLAWPVTLGGATGYVTVSGHSMEPTYYTGDLVITRADGPVRPGAVVVYTVPEGEPGAGLSVVHRVLREADGGWVTRGDNNTHDDPWTPGPGDISGTVVAHLPKLGYVLAYTRSPLVLAAAGGLVVGWILWPRRDAAPAPDSDPAGPPPGDPQAPTAPQLHPPATPAGP